MRRLLLLLLALPALAMARQSYPLNDAWHSVCYPEGTSDSLEAYKLQLPHNWDDYYGYRQYTHGNLHGRARYERQFSLYSLTHSDNADEVANQLYILHLEGAGSYVTVTVNGQEVCRHKPAGRVVTSLDITRCLDTSNPRRENRLVIECEHPSNITDLPWVCGGCSSEWGFSEGSAPLGLFREVSLEVSSQVRVEPFGVHAWANETLDTLWVDTELRNYSNHAESCVLQSVFEGKLHKDAFSLGAGLTRTVRQFIPLKGLDIRRWSTSDPVLYQVQSTVMTGTQHEVADRVETTVGFADVKWPKRSADGQLIDDDHRFYLNGEPVFVNGVCEYEHLFGQSHALSTEEIDHRCELIQHMGFNAVRDAHQPHNLRYGNNWARMGILWWPQFSAHIWYDTPQFRQNFKDLLVQWVKERRNNPAIVLWGLQNESTLPADFSRECADIIRELDPRCAHGGRLITTCNGGSGTDWNVVQNWSGTYGGRLADYGEELSKPDQLLNGEYGGWRTVGLHDDQDILPLDQFDPKATWSESHQCALLHAKLALAYQNRDKLCGQFQWILASHDNPGRQQPDEFLRVVDKVGPFNYKGLLTPMWEPTDAYYLYVAWGAFLRGEWPADLPSPTEMSARQMICLGYRLEKVPLPDYLTYEGATTCCERPDIHHFADKTESLAPVKGRVYLYRYNCGGDEVTDSYGNLWMGDDTRYSTSWSAAPQFAADSLSPVLASQAMVPGWAYLSAPDEEELLAARSDQPLLRSYRFGRHALSFSFPVPAGPIYHVDLWFVNSQHRISHVSYLTRSIWNGQLLVSFPNVKVGQAKVSAIAISLDKPRASEYGKPGPRGTFRFKRGVLSGEHPALTQAAGYPYSQGLTWAMLDEQCVVKTDKSTLPADKSSRPAAKFPVDADQGNGTASFSIQMGLAQEYALRFRYKNTSQPQTRAHWQLLAAQDGRLVAEGDITFPQTPPKFKVVSTTTGTFVNAGSYRLVLSGLDDVVFESVEVQ